MSPITSGSGRLPGTESRSREILNSLPAGGILICDTDLRVAFATGDEFERFGIDIATLAGNLLPEATPIEFWRQLLPSFESAAVGRSTTLDLGLGEELLAIQISPIVNGGAISGTLVVTPDSAEKRRVESITGGIDLSDPDAHDRAVWSDTINRAIAEDRMVLHSQPILNLATGEVDQHELLIRMLDRNDPSRTVLPGAFLPDAERLGLIPVLDRWVITHALEVARHRQVEINISAITISDPVQVREIESEITASGVPPENIIFEITETAVAENLESARHFAKGLRDLGCSFALDDFGVGFGTFTYLKHLPVHFLKIDIEFVRDLIHNDADRQVVNAIVGAARLFNMRTIAEGVEDQDTLDLLGEMNVDFAQGYWIGRPAPIAD